MNRFPDMVHIGVPICKSGRLEEVTSRDRTPFGQRMSDARRAAGLDQKEVAKAIGISQSTLSELEREAKGSSHVVAFASLYKVSAHWLATGEGSATEADTLSREALDIARAYEKMNQSERHRLPFLPARAAECCHSSALRELRITLSNR